MPPVLTELALRTKGLILVTGPSGSSKSTTLAAMIDKINSMPCSYHHFGNPWVVHHCKHCQQEIRTDTKTYASGLRCFEKTGRNPIGEMRDLEQFPSPLPHETGHLVLSTLHTTGPLKPLTGS